MEIANIHEAMISPSLQESIPARVKRSDGLAGKTQEARKNVEKAYTGAEDVKRDPDPESTAGGMKGAREEDIRDLLAKINQAAQSMRYGLQFVVNRDDGVVVIKVLDSEGKLIRQIPPELMAAASSGSGLDLGGLLNTVL